MLRSRSSRNHRSAVVFNDSDWFRKEFLLGHITSVELVNHTDAASTGTKMPRTNWSNIARFEIVLPPQAVTAAVTKLVYPLIERITANIHEYRTLAVLRNALLPKLLSGELSVASVAPLAS